VTTNKPILDATCGGRMMWFNKHNPACLYVDKRVVEPMKCCDGRNFQVAPDVVADFIHLPFKDDTFWNVVFDPPHLIHAGETSYMGIKYGILPEEWQQQIHDGFWECMRVLKTNGTLIFKWSEVQIKTPEVIRAIGCEPLYGHISGQRMNTHWIDVHEISEAAGRGRTARRERIGNAGAENNGNGGGAR